MKAVSTPFNELTKKKITLADYLLMPEINHPYEIIDGEMMPSPAPAPAHQRMSWNIAIPLGEYVHRSDLGMVLYAPLDIIIQRHPLRTRQPDVLFIHKDKLSGTGFDAIEELQILEIAPDLIIEVLSPSDTKKVLSEKLLDYQRIGVKECWLVSRESRSVEVLRLMVERSERVGRFGLGETLHSLVLPDFRLTVDEIFI
ncbi:MAG: Uma2 family endonuclease [Candidatus Poribacteria bacterium]|nr:Uma2 family endonuclease [Candidatus Poribacteria bacterium]